jgi:hypothetical protein
MKYFNIFFVLALCLFVPYVIADDDDDDDDDDEYRLVAVRTYLVAPSTTPSSVLQAIDAGMDSITDVDDRRELEEDANTRHLRSGEKERRLKCSTCTYYPSYYTGCWVKFVWVPRCRSTPRRLVAHRKLDDDELITLTSTQLSQYTQLAAACAQAIDDMMDDIDDATANALIPSLPQNASFVEECLFEEIDD